MSNHSLKMGGTIKAESTFGEETTFEVTIPQKISQIAESGSQEKYINEVFADYIAKPFSKTQIEEKMDKVFKKERN